MIQQSKERLVRLFHRALSLPLINNEALLSKCNEAFEGFFTESDISIIKPELLADKVAKSRKGLELRAPLELPIISIAQQMEERGELSPQQEEELIRLFHEYIAFETKQKEYSRVQRLYERAVLLVPSAILYVEFSLFLLVTVKQNALALSWLLKGYRRHRRCLVLHRLLIVAWEATNTPLDDLSTHYRTTIGSGLNSADDYLYFFMLVANSYCRRAFHCHGSEEERTAASDALTQLFEDVQTFLTTYFPDWLDGWYRWTKVRAEIDWKRHQQAQLITADATRRVGKAAARSPAWERLASISPGQWWIWQEAISFYASHQELEAARGLFRKVLHLSLDVSSVAVAEAFLAFEDLYGDLSTMLAALERVQNTLPAAAIAVAPSAEPTEATIATGEGAGASEQWPAAHADSALSSGEKKHRSKPVHQERAQKPLPKRKRPVESIEAPVSANSPASPQAPANTEPVPEERMPKKPRTSNNDESDGLAAAPSAILVQNLPFAAPFEAIRSFLLDCLAMQGVAAEQVSLEPLLSKAGHPRGVVRICFREASHLPRALALHGQSFQGRPVRVDLDTSYTPTPAAAPTSVPANAAPPAMEAAAATGGVASAATTVFVTGLAEETAEHDLAAFFEGCGPIAAIKVIVDKKTNTPKVRIDFLDLARFCN